MLAWIIEPAISLILFYLAYFLFLKRVTFFSANRYYLLTAILFSLLLPHINFTPPVSVADYSYLIPEITVTGQSQGEQLPEAGSPVTVSRVIMIIYLTGVGLLGMRLAIRLLQLYFLASRSNRRKVSGARIISLGSETAPFSFLDNIFINETLYREEEKQKIIEHELVHINQYHTLDRLLLELLTTIQWFNPVAWLYRRSMLEIHEYLADEEVIKRGTSVHFYQSMLMNLQMGREFFSPASNFNKSLTLNRIKMMTTIKPAAWKKINFFLLLPALMLLVLMCTKNEEEKSAVTTTELKIPTRASVSEDGILRSNPGDGTESGITDEELGEVFFVVEEMPGFQGGKQDEFREHIAENLRYPQIAAENGIEGRVFIQFVVKADGSVANAKVVRGVDPALDREAMRVVMASPDWTPGKQRGEAVNVAFTFPINFVLN